MGDFLEVGYRRKGKDVLSNQEHTHIDSYEFIQVWTDKGSVLIRDKIYPMNRGALFFIKGDNIHSTNPTDITDYERSKVIISAEFFEELAAISGLSKFIEDELKRTGGACFLPNREKVEAIDKIFKEMELAANDDGDLQKSYLTGLLLVMIKLAKCGANNLEQVVDLRIASVMDYINANLDKKIGVDVLCRVASVSRYYLCHLFKAKTGMTVSQYILHRRIELARKILLTKDISVSEVAMECGFSSFSYFSRIFRETEGVSPMMYRKVARSKDIWVE